jgi:hypothetical protein
MARASVDARRSFAATLRLAADELARRLGSRDEALSALALIVGGVALARAVDDTELSDALLAACRARVLAR